MGNTTDEVWSVDGVSLNQYAWNITTLGGSRSGLPPLRGEDVAYASIPGKEFRAKVPDSRVISLAMWVAGIDPSTDQVAADQVAQWNHNWRTLKRAFYTPTRQVTLERKIRYPGGLETHTAKAQVAGAMEPTMTGRTRSAFVVDLLLADPYFYGPEVTHTISGSGTINNPGDAPAYYANLSLVFSGAGRLTNTTPDPDVWVETTGACTLNCLEMTALNGASNVINGVTHQGSSSWMGLLQGANAMTSTTSVQVVYRPPYT